MSKPIAILALDMATSTGWALMDRKGVVTSGVQRFDLGRGESSGMRFLRFRRWLAEMLELGFADDEGDGRAVHVIAFERAHHRGGPATEVGVGLMTTMLSEAARVGCETLPVHTATLKQHATGKGNASKEEMRQAAGDKWFGAPGYRLPERPEAFTDDEADALCVLSWALDELGVARAAE